MIATDPNVFTPAVAKALRGPVAKAKKHVAAIAMHRDALRLLISDIETIADTADSAVEQMDAALDTLSQYL